MAEKAVKEAERREKEEMERKKANAQKRIMSFFQPDATKKSANSDTKFNESISDFEQFFQPFCVKADMTWTVYKQSESMELESTLNTLPQCKTLMTDIKNDFIKFIRKRQPSHYLNKYSQQQQQQRIIDTTTVSPSEPSTQMKLLQFAQDVRPAYFGTWSRKSQIITGRRWLAKDTYLLDYDIDSEAEWEDGDDEGEECRSDDEEEEEEVEEGGLGARMTYNSNSLDEDDEDGWLVPHGYLSEDEGEDKDEDEDKNTMTQKKSNLTSHSVPKRVQPLVPVIIGPIFVHQHQSIPIELTNLQLVLLNSNSTCKSIDPWEDVNPVNGEGADVETPRKRKHGYKPKKLLSEEHLPQLVKVNKNDWSIHI
ncbi:chromatin assembly factor 1 subunit A-domain-containing protein [Syncephalis fuscata]|nr:chromatin assembly factor 1 subunit A-domain-containing protein [Syncephalis fuscata]